MDRNQYISEITRFREIIRDLENEVAELRAENAELRAENERLRDGE